MHASGFLKEKKRTGLNPDNGKILSNKPATRLTLVDMAVFSAVAAGVILFLCA